MPSYNVRMGVASASQSMSSATISKGLYLWECGTRNIRNIYPKEVKKQQDRNVPSEPRPSQ